ncbi:G-protein coupled receptor family C group 5 member C [Gadus macrocephalus]|uniref:G-protein coupled receptor family C group 5 member C n=1 Tax=Gadus macrocephalus TaxID=80720 RepID=UPI0028CB702F|nr:G-protein coupled receptor family C group 5 member C [Gadus macrocephalus]
MAANSSVVQGCGPSVDSLYSNLCDLTAAWGIVLEALAAAGVVLSLVLFISLLAGIPFMTDKNQRSSLGLHACFLVSTLGLFCLTFAFIVGKDFATCASRRFLFGVLFAGCFSCLLMQSVQLNVLARRTEGPRGWALVLGAAGLFLVEAIINTEWLIITVVRYPLAPLNATAALGRASATPCNIANEDLVMALIYVMALIAALVLGSLAAMGGPHKQWRGQAAGLLLISLLSAGIWAAWIAMYVYGNDRHGSGPQWDDPTLAIALVASGWVFLLLHTVPEVCCWGAAEDSQESFPEDAYPSRAVGYETILKEQSSQNMFMENKAFSMDEPGQGNKGLKPVSPYSGYSGQLRSSVYQPTELALISQGHPQTELSYNTIIPRASTGSPAQSGGSTPTLQGDNGHAHGNNGNGLHKAPQW